MNLHVKHKYATKSQILLALTFTFFLAIVSLPAQVLGDPITRAFDSAENISPGWVVALNKAQSNAVVVAPANDPSRIFGVVIDPNQSPVTLQTDKGQKVFVATSNNYPVLVSTENGPINSGDYISMSSTDGIAAKATQYQSYILGKALEKFDGKNAITGSGTQEAIGRIAVSIQPEKNPLVKSDLSLPKPLRRVAESVAGKSVSAIKIYIAAAVFVISAVLATVILWAGIRNGMISIGRNPLSRSSILHGLVQVIIAAVAILIIGVFAVYLLLKL